jgi:hypothetical protein
MNASTTLTDTNSIAALVNPHERYLKSIPFSSHVRREVFDPNNHEHLKSYKQFLETGNWGKIQFYTEHPSQTVPATVERKFALCYINATLAISEWEPGVNEPN